MIESNTIEMAATRATVTSALFSIKTKIALIVSIFLWSSAFVFIRTALKGYSPGSLALFRFLIASFCMLVIYCYRFRQRETFQNRHFYGLLLFGAIGLGCYNYFLNYGEISVSAGIASFIISQSPLISMFFAILFLKEKWSLNTLLGIFISIIGVGLIVLGENSELKLGMGLIFILIATFVNALYTVLQKFFLNKYNATDVTIYIIWSGTVALLIFSPELIHDLKTAPLTATLSAIYLGIFPAAIAYLAWSYALAAIPASRCVSFLYFMPIIATLLGWLCLGEIPAVLSLLGGLIALAGVWWANK